MSAVGRREGGATLCVGWGKGDPGIITAFVANV